MLQGPKLVPSISAPYMTVQDLYTKFHGKPRPSSFPTLQNSRHFTPPSGMRTHQMRITSYFKPATNTTTNTTMNGITDGLPSPFPASLPTAKALDFNRKHDHSNFYGIWTGICHLRPSNRSPFSQTFASHFTYHTCRRCKQHFSSKNLLHRHLTHCRSTLNSKHPASNGPWRRHDHN